MRKNIEKFLKAYNKYANSHIIPGDPKGKTLCEQLDSMISMEHSFKSFVKECKLNKKFYNKWK